jgi:hypothetical protein
MAKNEKIQKKKTQARLFLDILFKILVGVAIIIFIYIGFTKVNFSSGEMDFKSPQKSKFEADAPEELKWFDSFKGIENVPSKKQEKKKESGDSSTGFNYQGFQNK